MIALQDRERSFTNQYGERFLVRVDSAGRDGELLGDETDWKALPIRDDEVLADFMFSEDEWDALESAWRELTGRTLRKPLALQVMAVMATLMQRPSSA